MKEINIILLLFTIILFSCERKLKNSVIENYRFSNDISDSLLDARSKNLTLKVDTVIGYICVYQFNNITQEREGKFESYYYSKEDKSKRKACEAEYYNGKLIGNCKQYDTNGVLRTEYNDISYDPITGLYSAIINIFDEKGMLNKEMKIKTSDDRDITLYSEDVDIEFIFHQK